MSYYCARFTKPIIFMFVLVLTTYGGLLVQASDPRISRISLVFIKYCHKYKR